MSPLAIDRITPLTTNPDADCWILVPATRSDGSATPQPAQPASDSHGQGDGRPDYCLHRTGSHWLLRFAGQEAILPHRKGFAYYGTALSLPEQSFASWEMRARLDGQDPQLYQSSGVELADRAYLNQLRERYVELQAEAEEAQRRSDWAAQERIAHEQDDVLATLRSVTGLGGKTRRRDGGERARTAVTNAMRRALQCAAASIPAIGRYWTSTIDTGRWIRFRPLNGERWSVIL